ncbi:MAG: PAS domain S-box protein, partial [candidate division Zixibacteria bacterium]|nr:PAS domain S-box protein [candidate division Zixibacteria bacterium]
MKGKNKIRRPFVDDITLLLLPRFITFIFLFGGSLFLLKSRFFIFELLVLYGVAAFAYLSLMLLKENMVRLFLPRILFLHILLEVVITGIMINQSGGSNSPFVLILILSIASAAMIFQLRGALFITLTSTISFFTSVYYNLEYSINRFSQLSFIEVITENSDAFFSVFLTVVLFTIVGVIAGNIAERLKDRGLLLKTAVEELRKAKLITSDILEGMRSGLICIDYSMEVLMLNRTGREILGLSRRKKLEGKVCEVFTDGLSRLCEFLEKTVTSETVSVNYETIVTRDDGTEVPIGISTSLLTGPDNKPSGIIASFTDLTEAKNLQKKIRIYDRLAAVGQLSAGIAHEIRNPLTSISGSVEVLSNELKLDGSNKKLMDVVITESQRLNRILSEFLLYARIKPAYFSKVNLKLLISDVISFISNDQRMKSSVELINNLTDEITVFGDEEKIRQVLFNLIFNAIGAVDDHNGLIHISSGDAEFDGSGYIVTGDFDRPVRSMTENDNENIIESGGYIPLSVADNGSGIPENKIEKVFQPFYSTRSGGTGLGLAIVQRLVESMDGVMAFKTKTGEGSTFTIFLKSSLP